jgi:hypothetical protein
MAALALQTPVLVAFLVVAMVDTHPCSGRRHPVGLASMETVAVERDVEASRGGAQLRHGPIGRIGAGPARGAGLLGTE